MSIVYYFRFPYFFLFISPTLSLLLFSPNFFKLFTITFLYFKFRFYCPPVLLSSAPSSAFFRKPIVSDFGFLLKPIIPYLRLPLEVYIPFVCLRKSIVLLYVFSFLRKAIILPAFFGFLRKPKYPISFFTALYCKSPIGS